MVNPKKNSNDMWKLDLLEAKFHNYTPRYPHTKKLLVARNNNKLFKKLPVSKEEAEKEILALKKELFSKKYYGSSKKLNKEVNKVVKNDLNRYNNDESKKSIIEFLDSEENIQNLVVSKLIKSITLSILVNKQLKSDPPSYIPEDICSIITDKSNVSNPSNFFIKHCQNNKTLNNYISNLWNQKSVKILLNEIEWSFKIVNGNLTKQERDERKKLSGRETQKQDSNEDNSEDDSEDDTDSDGQNEDDSDYQDESAVQAEKEDMEIDAEEAYEKFAIYDNLIGDSDNEQDNESLELDPHINYNEVTDEEPSESESEVDYQQSDSFFEDKEKTNESADERSKKTSKEGSKNEYKLPELAVGYYSGDSDDEANDVDNDKVVKELTDKRKNRRGQRARQKIWAKKYGKEAKHIKDEQAKISSEREHQRLEYEERCRKRELKAKLAMENSRTGSNTTPLGERKPHSDAETSNPDEKSTEKKMHPSWEAKKLAEEKLKNVKFTGKKIKFD